MDGYDAEPWNGVTDYTSTAKTGKYWRWWKPRKRSLTFDWHRHNLEYYVKEIENHQSFRPFGFLANGLEIYFEDVGISSKREILGFFTREDLENLLYLRQNAQPLSSVEINNEIVDRAYQHEAIRRIGEAFTQGKRKALIVMATGTGKTRTTMGLIDVFMRSNQARRVLFVADRDALVEQAKEDGFEKFILQEPCTRLRTYDLDTTKRLYAVTLQTLSNIFEQFSPAFFDLIVFDEVHRSIYNKFNEVSGVF